MIVNINLSFPKCFLMKFQANFFLRITESNQESGLQCCHEKVKTIKMPGNIGASSAPRRRILTTIFSDYGRVQTYHNRSTFSVAVTKTVYIPIY